MPGTSNLRGVDPPGTYNETCFEKTRGKKRRGEEERKKGLEMDAKSLGITRSSCFLLQNVAQAWLSHMKTAH